MLNHDENFVASRLTTEARNLERSYTIKPNDRLNVKVYTNSGERIIDPDYELNKGINQSVRLRPDPEYLVRLDGKVFLPMVGDVSLEGKTLHEADLLLSNLYAEYFTSPYIITSYTNKRVTVLGAPGGAIVPLVNENITVAEVLALAGGLKNTGKATNIVLLRNNDVYLIDFSTIDGFRDGNQIVQPGDIVYVEPIKRFLSENSAQLAIILSTLSTVTTLLVLIFR